MAKSKVDQINDAFISVLTKSSAKGYEQYIKSINKELIDNVDSLTPAKVKDIIANAKLNVDNIALLFLIQSAVLLIVNKKMSKVDKLALAPIIALTDMYSLKRPKKFVSKIVKIVNGRGLNERELVAKANIQKFGINNTKTLNNAKVQIRSELNRATSKSSISKRMIRELKIGLKQDKSIASIKNDLLGKYNKISNVERTLDTELHSASETVRQLHAESLGMKYKVWNSQEDSRVRNTTFHNHVIGKRVKIDTQFSYSGMKADRPGDNSLPPSERIRCRCYLTYESS